MRYAYVSTIYVCTVQTDMQEGRNRGISGGISWTRKWLRFDNTYFSRILTDANDPELLWLPTDIALLESPEFKPFFIRYAHDQEAFFHDYSVAHKKLSELGARFSPPQGIVLEAR